MWTGCRNGITDTEQPSRIFDVRAAAAAIRDAGFGLGMIEGLTKVVYPQGANLVVFLVMAVVLLASPAGLFGRR